MTEHLDVWMLKQFGTPRELLDVADFASDALPMYLASAKTYSSLLQYKTDDTGNKMVSALLVLATNIVQQFTYDLRK
jgi:hypothetical protein